MPTAKNNFIERLVYLRKTLLLDILNDKSTSEVEHNNIAKFLRNGLAVVGFVAIEDYIKKRTSEILNEISRTTVPFNNLPEKLQYSSTVGSLNSLIRLVKSEPTRADEINFIQLQTSVIASTANTAYDLSEYSFGYKNSNINSADIGQIMGSFYIKESWRHMTRISSRIGLTSFPLDNSFENAARRRHRAAHNSTTNTPIVDLEQFISEAFGIAISFDSLLVKSLNLICAHNTTYLTGGIFIDNAMVNLSFIKKENGLWKYKRENQARAIKNNTDKTILKPLVISLAQSRNETLIIYDENGHIEEWQSY